MTVSIRNVVALLASKAQFTRCSRGPDELFARLFAPKRATKDLRHPALLCLTRAQQLFYQVSECWPNSHEFPLESAPGPLGQRSRGSRLLDETGYGRCSSLRIPN